MKVYFVSFLARPEALAESEATGAYVNCWVYAASADAAQSKAEKDIRAQGWRVEAVEDPIGTAKRTAESAEYFDQAKVDGEVYVFHTWSGPDESPIH